MKDSPWSQISKIAFLTPFMNPFVYLILAGAILATGGGDDAGGDDAGPSVFIVGMVWGLGVIMIGAMPALLTGIGVVVAKTLIGAAARFPVLELIGLVIGSIAVLPLLYFLWGAVDPWFFLDAPPSDPVAAVSLAILSGGCSGIAAARITRKGDA